MGKNTIPTPTEGQFSEALSTLMASARSHGVDTKDKNTLDFIIHIAEVRAWHASETLWLHNIIHNRSTT